MATAASFRSEWRIGPRRGITDARRQNEKRILCFAAALFVILISAPGVGVLCDDKEYSVLCERMVDGQIFSRGIRSQKVLDAMRAVPRHEFVPIEYRDRAYDDYPLPIGYGQTISQPYIVALMTELADIGPAEKVLEIGTGSGYQAAIVSEVAREVYTIEIVESLADEARSRLIRLGYTNVHVRHGDGYRGWPEEAPFDAIIVTAAPVSVPEALLQQVADKGKIVIPVGTVSQKLQVITKAGEVFTYETVIPVRFVPMVHAEATISPTGADPIQSSKEEKK